MLRKIASAAAVATAWPVAQAADAGSGVPTGAQTDSSNAVAPHQADATFANYRFPTNTDVVAVCKALGGVKNRSRRRVWP
jgi:hypothetical protein